MARPPPRGPPRKPLWRVSVFGLLSAMIRFVLCDLGRYVYRLLPLVLSVPVFVLIYQSGLRAEPIPSGVYSLFNISVDAFAFQERTLVGGAARPLGIKVSWGVSSEEGGAAHGPLHPALFSSKFLAFCFVSDVSEQVL